MEDWRSGELDNLDGICGFRPEDRLAPITTDEERLGLILFADIDWTNPVAVTNRRTEWQILFGGGDA
jgi:hypothetical protein